MQTQNQMNKTQTQNGIPNSKLSDNHQSSPTIKCSAEQEETTLSKKNALQGTFDKISFEQLKRQQDFKNIVPPMLDLSVSLLMTQNMKEVAGIVNGLTTGGTSYFLKNDYIGDSSRLQDAIQSVSRLLGNLGTSDKASNYFLEKRNLMKALSKENNTIRDLLEEELLEFKFSSDEEENQQQKEKSQAQEKPNWASETQEDSEEAIKNKKFTQHKIETLIKQIRQDGKSYLNLKDTQNINSIPLRKIVNKLKLNERYIKKRVSKGLSKGIVGVIEGVKSQLEDELQQIQILTDKIKKPKNELIKEIYLYEQSHGLEKRLKSDQFNKSISEIDQLPLTSKSYEIQNILFNYCGINLKGNKTFSHKKSVNNLFGTIKVLPQKSTLLQCYQDQGENKGTFIQNENSITNQARKKNLELVKVIGLEPEKFFQTLDKYKVRLDKLPRFSNVFERAEPIIPGLGMTVAGSLIQGNQNGQMSFTRVDGRNVISLQFNPYELDDPQKKKIYDTAVKDLVDSREKIKAISLQAKEKQEQSNIKRAWLNIVKKDIPKSFRSYQKYKADLDNFTKKQSANCMKEVRKRAAKTVRLQKEAPQRAKKLTKDMMNFWKRRDKEMADLKKRKEKFEKEIKRKQEEEKEALLQKKRLEYIMQQSEIYAHFMSKKLGLHDEQSKQRQADIENEKKENFVRVDIDESGARAKIAEMINENISRVVKFDQEVPMPQASKKQLDKNFQNIKEEELFIDKFDNPDASHSKIIEAPKSFKGHLKDYQLKGLRWLDNLYEQGINGILADEMGLGKTIQAIALLAHLAENKGVWGPFLIVVPVTTLHNWQNELAKFCPKLVVLPYFGSPEERKKLGRFLDPKNLYNPSMQINVLLTSYNLLVNNSKDQQKLIRVRWHYIILDEAQAIKNNLSRRWRVLLEFNARNRLLLTGTPIQNTMAELWALLHFIMPRLFDSHEQFQEWFSKDIEQHSQNQGEINRHQLKRLHLVLKPFMLRRLKKDVEQEIGLKKEYDKYCEMTHRQRVLYQRIKNKISTKDLFQLVDSKQKMENLMNLVMQFRKVCNHPELFERRIGRIPFSFRALQQGMQLNMNYSSLPDVRSSMKNPIAFEIPKLVYDECFIVTDNMTTLFRKIQKHIDFSFTQVSVETHMRFFNIFNTLNLHQQIFGSKSSGSFGALRLLQKSNRWSLGELSYLFVADPLIKQIALMHYYSTKYQRRVYYNTHNTSSNNKVELKYDFSGPSLNSEIDIVVSNFYNRDECSLICQKTRSLIDQKITLQPLIPQDLNEFTKYSLSFKQDIDIYVTNTIAETVQFYCRSSTFSRLISSLTNSIMHKKVLIGKDFKPKIELAQGKIGRDRSSFLTEDSRTSWKNGPPVGYNLLENGIIGQLLHERGACLLELPNYSRLVTDCAKMQFLDKLLNDLNRQKHRCLIFCQMTKMLDILEDFLCWKKYTYFRMDGSTSIPDRRYMVEEYQKNPDIFAFLLSTRAGGLGVNLTGADTVIFYDNDWNPTMDAQATDRAHRIGQTKPVSVYRIITKGTVEEKIVKRAKQKQTVQSTVYGGNNLKADVFKPKDVVEMLLDEEEQNELKERSQKFLKTKRIKKKFQIATNTESNQAMTEEVQVEDTKEEVMQINTSSLNQVNQAKEQIKKPDNITQEIKKPINIKKITESKQQIQQKQQQQNTLLQSNIFATNRDNDKQQQQQNVFSVQKSQVLNTQQIQQDIQMNNGDQLEQDEVGQEEYEGVEKFLDLLQNKDYKEEEDDEDYDDEEGVEFEFNEEEAIGIHEVKKNKVQDDISKGKQEISKDEEIGDDGNNDEDMMDDY